MEKPKTKRVPAARSPEIPSCGRRKFHIKKVGVTIEPYAPLVYLSVPYSDDDPNVVLDRVKKVDKVAADLMKKGFVVFSPISHNHPIAVGNGLPTNWEYWERFCQSFITCSHKLFVLKLPGWKESAGAQGEIKIATEMGLDIVYIDPVL